MKKAVAWKSATTTRTTAKQRKEPEMNCQPTIRTPYKTSRTDQRRTRFDVEAIRSAAYGRWRPTIYPSLGIEVGHGQHLPCPFCGGNDRFFCDDLEGRGTWFCRQCDPQAGDGFDLIMKVKRCDFSEAIRLVADVLGVGDGRTMNTRNKPSVRIPKRLDLKALSFQLELAALDRRLRADAVLQAVADFRGDELTDHDRDQLVNAVARAFEDINHAELLEHAADDFRLRVFQEKEARHAA